MKLLDWFSATLFLAASANAQPGMAAAETARARTLLGSPNLQGKAWGAYFAARLHDASFLEPLISQLRLQIPFSGAGPDLEEHAYIQTLFDALIELGLPVPAEAVLPFEAQWRAETLILLARDPANGDELLKMREETLTDVEWLAVNNLLLRFRLPAVFAKILQELKITHTFQIVDPQTGVGGGGAIGGSWGGGRTWRAPLGFPPLAAYLLEDGGVPSIQFAPAEDALSGDVLLAPGPRNIYYKRTVVPSGGEGRIAAPRPQAPDRQQFLLEYVSRLCQLSAEGGVNLFHPVTMLSWRDSDDAARFIDAALERQASAIAGILTSQKQLGRVSLDGIQLEIEPALNDFRHNASGALPIVSPKPIPLD